MAIKLQTGSSTTGQANVDAGFNLATTLPQVTTPAGVEAPQYVGGARNFSENDAGTVTGTASLKSPETSLDFRTRVGIDTLLFNDTFNAITQNTNTWSYTLATLTATQPGAGTVNFGTVQGTAITHGAFMKTFQYFPIIGTAPLSVEFKVGSFTSTLVANEEWRMGLGNPTVAGTAPTDGVWLKMTSVGLIGEIGYSGVITPTGTLLAIGAITNGTIYKYAIVIGEGEVEFWRDDVLLGTLALPVGNGQPFIQGTLPAFMQKLCTGNVTNTNTMRVSDVTVSLLDIATNKSWEAQLATMGQGGNLGQNGNTQGKTSLYANATAPTAVALTNTTAAFTGLGGQAAVLPTLAVSTDGILMNFTNPASTINITGRNLLIYGVQISSHVSVLFDAAAAIVYQASLQYGHTAVSLVTAETGSFVTATTHSPRVVPLGTIGYGVALAAPARTLGNPLEKEFVVPIIVRPGENVAIVLKAAVGSVITTTGAVTFMVNYDSVWE